MKENEQQKEYYDTEWAPMGWDLQEWQIMWRKLWLLSKEELKKIAEEFGETKTMPQTKSEFIEYIACGASEDIDAEELKNKVNDILSQKGYHFIANADIEELDKLLREKGIK